MHQSQHRRHQPQHLFARGHGEQPVAHRGGGQLRGGEAALCRELDAEEEPPAADLSVRPRASDRGAASESRLARARRFRLSPSPGHPVLRV